MADKTSLRLKGDRMYRNDSQKQKELLKIINKRAELVAEVFKQKCPNASAIQVNRIVRKSVQHLMQFLKYF